MRAAAALLALALLLAACTGDSVSDDAELERLRAENAQLREQAASTAPSTAVVTPVPAPTSWAQGFSGTGPTSTPSFQARSSTWQVCFAMTSWATLSDGTPIGVIFVNVRRESDGGRVGELAGDAAQSASRTGCTTIRDGPGRYYFDINTGAGAGWWSVTAES